MAERKRPACGVGVNFTEIFRKHQEAVDEATMEGTPPDAKLDPLFALLPRLEQGDETAAHPFVTAIVEGLRGHPYQPPPTGHTDWSTATEDVCKRRLVFLWRADYWEAHGGYGKSPIEQAIASGEAARIVRRLREVTAEGVKS